MAALSKSEAIMGMTRNLFPDLDDEGAGELLGAAEVMRGVVDAGSAAAGVDRDGIYRGKITLKTAMSDSQASYLKRIFGDTMNLTIRPGAYAIAHEVANKARQIVKYVQRNELIQEYDLLEGNEVAIIGETSSVASTVYAQDFKIVMAAAPILSGRDANRFTSVIPQRFDSIDTSAKLHELRGKARFIVATDVYAWTMSEAAEAMTHLQADVFSYAILKPTDFAAKYNSELRNKRTPVDDQFQMEWHISGDGDDAEIHMYANEQSLGYKERMRDYLDKVTPMTQVVTKYGVFHNERIRTCGPYEIFHIYRERAVAPCEAVSLDSNNDEMSELEIFVGKKPHTPVNDVASYITKLVQVPTRDFNRLILAIMTDTKTTLQSATRSYHAIRAVSVYATKAERIRARLSIEDEAGVMLSAVLIATNMRRRYERDIESSKRLINAQRNLDNTMSDWYNPLTSLVSSWRSLQYIGVTFGEVINQSDSIKRIVDAVTLKSMYKLCGLIGDSNFTPKCVTMNRLLAPRPRLLINYSFEAQHIQNRLDETSLAIMSQFAVEDLIVDESQKSETLTVVEDELQFKLPDVSADEASMTEYVQMVKSNIFDILKAVRETWIRMHLPNVVYEKYAEESWHQYSQYQEQVTLVTVDGGVVKKRVGYSDECTALLSVDVIPEDLMSYKPQNLKLTEGSEICVPDGTYFTTKELLKFFEPAMLVSVAALRPSTVPRSIEVTTGIPGVGKSYHMVRRFTPTSVVFFKTRLSRDDAYKDLVEYWGEENVDSRRVRTTASILQNSVPRTDDIIIDEVLLMPYGEILACIAKIVGENVYDSYSLTLMGDAKQIAYSARRQFKPMLQVIPERFWHENVTRFDNVTLRSPARIVHMISPLYGELSKLNYTTNHVSGGVSIAQIRSIKDVPKFKDVHYIVYTQVQCVELSRHMQGLNVSIEVASKGAYTPEESQGTTKAFVIIVRPDSKVTQPYLDMSFFNVAVTRATHGVMLLHTPVKSDDMIKAFQEQVPRDVLETYHNTGGSKPVLHTDNCRCGAEQNSAFEFFRDMERRNGEQQFGLEWLSDN